MTYSNLIEPISPKESPAEFPDASVDGDDNTDGDIKQIVETGSVTVSKDGHYIHCLTVIGQIEGHFILPPQNKTTKYEHVIPQLVAIEESRDIEGLIIILNTVGGDIEAGLALAELLSGMRKPTVSLVLGGGHSIGVPLAVSAKKGTGLEELKELFCTLLRDNKILVERTISYQEAGILQQIRKSGELLEEEYRPEGIFIRAYVTPEIYGSL